MNKPTPGASNGADREEYDPPDADLVTRCQSGDMEAFDGLVTRYRGKVYAMIYQIVRNDADAWDLSQDVFLKAWKAIPKFEARSGFYTWIFRIAHNATYDFLRKKKLRPAGEFDDRLQAQIEPGAKTVPQGQERPDEALVAGELGGRINEALEKLSEEQRSAILLKEVQGLKYEEIAEVQGCSLGTVMSRLFYARKKLQSLLQDTYENS